MDVFEERLNDILVNTFWNILKVQEQFVNRLGDIKQLSMSEMHLLEVVGNWQKANEKTDDLEIGCSVTVIAETLDITLPSVTVALKKLVAKGCVAKHKAADDGRIVVVELTPFGQEIFDRHHNFHKRMVGAVSADLSLEEKEILIKGIQSLNDFFKQKIVHENI